MIRLGTIMITHPALEKARIRIPPRVKVKAKAAIQPRKGRVIPGKVGMAEKEALKVPWGPRSGPKGQW